MEINQAEVETEDIQEFISDGDGNDSAVYSLDRTSSQLKDSVFETPKDDVEGEKNVFLGLPVLFQDEKI